MRTKLGSWVACFVLMGVDVHAESERWLAIRQLSFRVDAPDRIAEIEQSDDWKDEARRKLEEIEELLRRSAEGDTSADAEIERRYQAALRRGPGPGADVMTRDGDRRIWEATRGLDPHRIIECFAREHSIAQVSLRDDGFGQDVVRAFRLARLGKNQAVIEITDDPGADKGGPFARWTAWPRDFDRMHVIERRGDGGTSVDLEFLELREVERPTHESVCEVRYAAGAPAAAAPLR